MDGLQGGDPFLWGVTAVEQRLCAPGSPWTRDAAALAARVRDEEIDGRTLLTYEHLLSRAELMECLNIRVARHKIALVEIILKLRHQSPGYHAWLRNHQKQQADLVSVGQEAESVFLSTDKSPSQQPAVLPAYEGMEGVVQHNSVGHTAPKAMLVNGATTQADQGLKETAHREPGSNEASIDLPLIPGPSTVPPALASTQELPINGGSNGTPKRKRVAPVNLSATPFHKTAVPIPTEADNATGYAISLQASQAQGEFPWDSSPSAYLGAGSLSMARINSSEGSISSRVIALGKDQFFVGVANPLPPGRRLVVYRGTKRLLRENSRKEVLLQQGLRLQSLTPSDDEDPILALSDLPDSFDDQTLREIQAEKLELERFQQLQGERFLDKVRVREILDESVARFVRDWEASKLPKYQSRAWKLWRGAFRAGTKKSQVLRARKEAKLLEARIKKLYVGIMDEKWSRESEVRLQSRSLEQSIEDKLYKIWLVDVLESRVEPPKPSSIPLPKRPVVARPTSPSSGEELLSSDDDDGDFIVPDEPELLDQGEDAMLIDSMDNEELNGDQAAVRIEPVKSEEPVHVDLTQVTPMENQKGRIEIDLTMTPEYSSFVDDSNGIATTRKESKEGDAPPIESFGKLEKIGAENPAHWVKEQKRYHLVLCLVWRLPHTRRSSLLRLVQDRPASDVWASTIQRHFEAPFTDLEQLDAHPESAMALDTTRIFFSFLRTKNMKEARVTSLKDRHKQEMEKQRTTNFPHFCDFLSRMASEFPDDRQIYIEDLDDVGEEDVGDEEAPGSQDTPTKMRKMQRREIVQDKGALETRDREMKRVEWQRARQAKLRAKLSMTNTMSRDKSRLIINETKEDDQSFIYVNEEIAKRIKDHQIDGVRFLWNQVVVQEPGSRQGCLLAHTMGLGKTMQVITLLVAIAESAMSPDPTVVEQIPEYLRESKTLILCPAGLVENWMDEILIWAPAGLLGDIRKIDSQLATADRYPTVKDWARKGGLLLMGYTLFARLSSEDEMRPLLIETPNMVVADEAHYLKSPEAKTSMACSQFRTMSRIALTGSPLANNVKEYHSMIDWVAPNFLGPRDEFKEMYERPIQQGLWGDSAPHEKRRAIKMLQVLKDTVGPKIHRATIKSTLNNDLPPKFEFVITIAATEMQERLYNLYIEHVTNTVDKIPQAKLFGMVNDLTLICNHPQSFQRKVADVKGSVGHDEEEDSQLQHFSREMMSRFEQATRISDMQDPSLSAKVELLINILNEALAVGDKVLVFSQSILTMDYLTNLFRIQQRKFQRLDGKVPIARRLEMIKEFNSGAQDVYIISTKAGGVGLNIQGANRVVIFDFKWNPVDEQQAIARSYRIGQKKTVFVYQFVVAGSFEEDLQSKAVFKMQLASRVVDKKNPISWSKRRSGLLHHIKHKEAEDLAAFVGKDGILDALIAAPGQRVIRSIVSTDTFEEEDPTVNLTKEERNEAANLVHLNRLRNSDPQAYQRLKNQEAMARSQLMVPSSSMPRPPPSTTGATPAAFSETPVHLPHQPQIHQGLDGTSDYHGYLGSRPNAQGSIPSTGDSTPWPVGGNKLPSVSYSAPAPLPMVGANTFFRSQPAPQVAGQTGTSQNGTGHDGRGRNGTSHNGTDHNGTGHNGTSHNDASSQPENAEGRGPLGSIFTPIRDEAKVDFERQLCARLGALQEKRYLEMPGSAAEFATSLTSSIDTIRKERGFGFLPDNQQWKFLAEFLGNDRFLHKVVAGHVTPSFLALVGRAEMERRIDTFNGGPVEDFRRQLARGLTQPEPHNLQNIQRVSQRPPEARLGTQAREDLKVMREAADNRRSRSARLPLPSWANEALSAGSASGSPSGETEA